ncbi:hypothetical protein N24_2748 [Corynebacterium suranareeae]|uniref:Uncharacterized protein n=1 Tax=Corynebacterium suranareeae TaxID=2506452 RepID=A0A160PW05_9CORY|nr:hypothetical protein [Corynebacterium suranareeae]BAU97010.1 hypothetical protein N24_2748 [Corynebacterium suranareeae]
MPIKFADQLTGKVKEFTKEFQAVIDDLFEERISSLHRSLRNLYAVENESDLDLHLTSSLITVEEEAAVFNDAVDELKIEFFQWEEAVIEEAWEAILAKLTEEKARRESTDITIPQNSESPGSDNFNDSFQLQIQTAKLLVRSQIADTEKFVPDAHRGKYSHQQIRLHLDNIRKNHRAGIQNWFIDNAKADDPSAKLSASHFKRDLDLLQGYGQVLLELLEKIEAGTFKPIKLKPKNKQPDTGELGGPKKTSKASTVGSKKLKEDTLKTEPSKKTKEFTLEALQFLEEDFYRYRSLWNHVFNGPDNEKEKPKLLKFKEVLELRQADLNRWRNLRSFDGDHPESLQKKFSMYWSTSKIKKSKKSRLKATNRHSRVDQSEMRSIIRDVIRSKGSNVVSDRGTWDNRRVFLTTGAVDFRAKR